jgi:hypothetical protein
MVLIRLLMVLMALVLAPIIFALIHVLIALALFMVLCAIIFLILTGELDEHKIGKKLE